MEYISLSENRYESLLPKMHTGAQISIQRPTLYEQRREKTDFVVGEKQRHVLACPSAPLFYN